MPKTLIQQCPTEKRVVDKQIQNKLAIAEMFCDTLQGEGIHSGVVATFLRLQGCTLKCTWCDTLEVWSQGNEYTFDEIFALMDSVDLPNRLMNGQHLILTGGSPLKQQHALTSFIKAFITRYDFKPYIEVENETVLMPISNLYQYVDCWNNSPKLKNSGMKDLVRYKPEIIKYMSEFGNSWFKFVVRNEEDWNEIESDFLKTDLIKRSQIILMPEGQNQDELSKTREITADIAIKQQVRFCDRLHVTIWDRKTGV